MNGPYYVSLTDEQLAIAQKAADTQGGTVMDVLDRWIKVMANFEKEDLDARQKNKDLDDYIKAQRAAKNVQG